MMDTDQSHRSHRGSTLLALLTSISRPSDIGSSIIQIRYFSFLDRPASMHWQGWLLDSLAVNSLHVFTI